MKPVYIALLLFITLPRPIFSIVNIIDTKRYVTVKMRHEHGAVIIKSKKVRVPYTMEQTSLPVRTNNFIDYLFLKSGNVNFGIVLAQLIIGIGIFLFCVFCLKRNLEHKYRKWILTTMLLGICLFAMSEFLGSSVTLMWLNNTQNGIINNPGLFGGNATFFNRSQGVIFTEDELNLGQLIIPAIALVLMVLDSYRRDKEAAFVYNEYQQQL